jgi:hypothetical protein
MRVENNLDMTGFSFCKLTVIKYVRSRTVKNGHDRYGDQKFYSEPIWLCRCECGREIEAKQTLLRAYRTTSCGCNRPPRKKRSKNKEARLVKKNPVLYARWRAMKQACDNKNHRRYRTMGGAGIEVCFRWYNFDLFMEDIGNEFDGNSRLMRRDNKKGYNKENCYWAPILGNGKKGSGKRKRKLESDNGTI